MVTVQVAFADGVLHRHPVVGNDDSESAMALYVKLFTDAVMRGKVCQFTP